MFMRFYADNYHIMTKTQTKNRVNNLMKII